MANKRLRKEGNPSEAANLAKMTSFGVCTRAKTMALKGSMPSHVGDGCYLHLRSRQLERFPTLFLKKARKNKCAIKKKGFHLDEKENVGVIKFEEKHKNKEKFAFGENEGENRMVEKHEKVFKRDEMNKSEDQKIDYDDKVEDSFGENDLDFENKERITRESTPSSLIMGKDEITTTPMSSNKATTIVKQMKLENPIKPSVQELEVFFADAEKHRIEIFIKKYNFDLVKEKPYEGRFEWVKIKP